MDGGTVVAAAAEAIVDATGTASVAVTAAVADAGSGDVLVALVVVGVPLGPGCPVAVELVWVVACACCVGDWVTTGAAELQPINVINRSKRAVWPA